MDQTDYLNRKFEDAITVLNPVPFDSYDKAIYGMCSFIGCVKKSTHRFGWIAGPTGKQMVFYSPVCTEHMRQVIIDKRVEGEVQGIEDFSFL